MSIRAARQRQPSGPEPEIGRFRAQHLDVSRRHVDGIGTVSIDDAESPLIWLARRKGRDGRALIEPIQLLAGERLRSEFTRAQLMPRVTANWSAAVADGARGASAAGFTDAVLSARQRVHRALDAVGPEFSGLLLDVCCFLKSLTDVEGERGWPARSGKVVLQLGLDRLARHYGLDPAAHGKVKGKVQAWLADDAAFVVEQYGGG